MPDINYKLSPSDFAYLWEECKHCYYQKIKFGTSYYGPFPSMFTYINSTLQNSIMNSTLSALHPDLPDAIVESQEKWTKSKLVPGTKAFVTGKYDILALLGDNTYALIDFKITSPDEEKILKKYGSQLHAYKYALENPDNGNNPIQISVMGVVSVKPEDMKIIDGKLVFTASPVWHPIEPDMDGFYNMIREINQVLDGDLPAPSENCSLCIYRSKFKPQQTSVVEDLPF